MITELYHGTRDVEALLKAFEQHLLIDGEYSRRDPGDFGHGFYCTTKLEKASAYGEVVVVQIDMQDFAFIPNPYFTNGLLDVRPASDVEILFHDIAFDRDGNLATVTGPPEQRERVAQRLRDSFLAHEYDGIRTSYHGDVCVFNMYAIKGLTFSLTEPITQLRGTVSVKGDL